MTHKTMLILFTTLCYSVFSFSQDDNRQKKEIERYDVVISEIMADPTPTVLLPDAEYIELYNRTEEKITLEDYQIQIGNTLKALPDIEIDAKGYALIVSKANIEKFSELCSNVYSISSMTLTDGGQQLSLINSKGEIIHSVFYRKEWHSEKIKAEGGWSLEMIDSNFPCLDESNWQSSEADEGGTPCALNSVSAENQDYVIPELIKATLLTEEKIRVFFNEPIAKMECDIHLFSIDKGYSIKKIEEVPPSFNAIDIQLNAPLQINTSYTLSVSGLLYDCAGNVLSPSSTLRIAVPQHPLSFDIVINEILTNSPGSTDADFIELYNRSEKVVDLKEIKLGSGGDKIPDKATIADPEGRLFFPKEYLAICKNKKQTTDYYTVYYPNQLVQCDELPGYPNTEGVVHLTDLSFNKIDRFAYSEKMHYSMLTTTDGVSLERINRNAETENENNWKSAAASVGFATPGYQNSNYRADDDMEEDMFTIMPEVITPNQDGTDDFTTINCNFPDAENRVSIIIYNRNGVKIKEIANNEYCSQKATYRWDGITENGKMANSDIYIIRMTYWNRNGKTKSIKKSIGVYAH